LTLPTGTLPRKIGLDVPVETGLIGQRFRIHAGHADWMGFQMLRDSGAPHEW